MRFRLPLYARVPPQIAAFSSRRCIPLLDLAAVGNSSGPSALCCLPEFRPCLRRQRSCLGSAGPGGGLAEEPLVGGFHWSGRSCLICTRGLFLTFWCGGGVST